MTTTRSRHPARTAGLILAAALGLTAAGCSGASNADPGTTLPTTPKDTAVLRDHAIQSAKGNYKAWVAMDPMKRADLPPEARRVATRSAIDHANEVNKTMFTKGVTAKGDTRIVSMRVTSYERHPDWTLVMRTCVATNLRFFKGGKNISVDPQGKPIPKDKETRADNVVTFRPGDNDDVWRIDTITPKDESC